MKVHTVSFKQDILLASLALLDDHSTLVVVPTEKNKTILQRILQTAHGIDSHGVMTMSEVMMQTLRSEQPVVTDKKRHLFFHQILNDQDRAFFKIRNQRDSFAMATEFFSFWEELADERVREIPPALLASNQQDLFDHFMAIRKRYYQHISKHGYADKIFLLEESCYLPDFVKNFERILLVNELYFSRRQREFWETLAKQSEVLLTIQAPEKWVDPIKLRLIPHGIKEISPDQTRLSQISHYKVPDSFTQLIQAISILGDHREVQTLIDTDFYNGVYPMFVSPNRFLFQRFTSFSQTPFYRWLKTWACLLQTRCEGAWSVESLYEAACWQGFSIYYSWDSIWKNFLRDELSKGRVYLQPEQLHQELFRQDAGRMLTLNTWTEWKIFLAERAERLVEDPFHALTWQGYFEMVVQLDHLEDEGFLQGINVLEYFLEQLALVPISLPASVPEEGAVRVESLMNSRNVSEDTVLLLNMTEGRIPTPRKTQFLFSENQRKRLGLKTHEDILQRERYNFMQKVLSAKHAILFSMENEEENLTTSSFVEELLLAFPNLRTVSSSPMEEEVFQEYLALFRNANATAERKISTPATQDDLPQRQKTNRTNLSYSAFSSLQTCAYQFGLRYDYAFRPGERQTSRDMKASTLGMMIHDLFNLLGEELQKQLSADQTSFIKLSEHIPYEKLIRHTYERHLLYIPASWRIRYFEEILLPLLKESMQMFVKEVIATRFSPAQISRLYLEEKTSAIPVSDTLSLEARADLRIETHEGSAWIIDFKTGATKDRQQLDFYELYYYPGSSSIRVEEKLFYNVLEAHCDFPITDQLLTIEFIEKAVHSLRSEAHYLRTTARSRCLYCNYKDICCTPKHRADVLSREKP